MGRVPGGRQRLRRAIRVGRYWRRCAARRETSWSVPRDPAHARRRTVPRWRNAKTLEFGSGQRFYVRHMDTGRTDTISLKLSVPRDIPNGSVALTNARILTMDHRKVINGTVVVKGSRISC